MRKLHIPDNIYISKDSEELHPNAPAMWKQSEEQRARDFQSFKDDCTVGDKIELRLGAQVMLCKNLDPSTVAPQLRLVNGSRGVVVGFHTVQDRLSMLQEEIAAGQAPVWSKAMAGSSGRGGEGAADSHVRVGEGTADSNGCGGEAVEDRREVEPAAVAHRRQEQDVQLCAVAGACDDELRGFLSAGLTGWMGLRKVWRSVKKHYHGDDSEGWRASCRAAFKCFLPTDRCADLDRCHWDLDRLHTGDWCPLQKLGQPPPHSSAQLEDAVAAAHLEDSAAAAAAAAAAGGGGCGQRSRTPAHSASSLSGEELAPFSVLEADRIREAMVNLESKQTGA